MKVQRPASAQEDYTTDEATPPHPEQIVCKLPEDERCSNEGKDLTEVIRHLEVSEPTWNLWWNQ